MGSLKDDIEHRCTLIEWHNCDHRNEVCGGRVGIVCDKGKDNAENLILGMTDKETPKSVADEMMWKIVEQTDIHPSIRIKPKIITIETVVSEEGNYSMTAGMDTRLSRSW